jgi:tungstate transport system permease protein
VDGPFATAFSLIASGDPALMQIIGLSLARDADGRADRLRLIGLPLGAALALARFPGRGAVIVVFNALMGLPPVVAGLVVYLLLSRSGPLGSLALLFTPTAMIIAQTLLILPIVVSR